MKKGEYQVLLSKKISKRIKELRLSKKMTQEELAEKANIDASNLGKIERGQRENLSLDTLEKIIIAFEISYEEFFSFGESDELINNLLYELTLSKNKEKLIAIFLEIVKLNS